MKTVIAVLVGGLMLSQAVYATETSNKRPVNDTVKVSYEATFEKQLEKTNAAIIAYSSTDCTSPEFKTALDTFVKEANALGDLTVNMPKDLELETQLKLLEEAYGAKHFMEVFVEQQNTCIDDHKSNPNFKLERGSE